MRNGPRGRSLLPCFCCPGLAAGQDRSKKAYELIYEDIQALKQQVLAPREEGRPGGRGRSDAVEGRSRRPPGPSSRSIQTEQSALRGSVKNVPSQYQVSWTGSSRSNVLLDKIPEDLMTAKGSAPPAAAPGQEAKAGAAATAEKKPPEARRARPPAEDKPAPSPPPSTNLSPQDVYNTAYSDYLKGNFDLAIDGFKLYRRASPTARWPTTPSTGSASANTARRSSPRRSTSSTS